MAFEKYFLKNIFPAYSRFLDNMPVPNFHWLAEWRITQRCNLKCTYCIRDGQRVTPENLPLAVENIKKTKPKIVIITGGEPFLVDNLEKCILEIKESINPKIRVTTNLIYRMEKIFKVLPHLQLIHVSIDGLGKHNKLNRGIDGDFVIKRIEQLAREIEKLNLKITIMTFTVLSRDNGNEEVMIPLAEKLQSISPNIYCLFASLMPPSNPYSVLHDINYYNTANSAFLNLEQRFGKNKVGFFSPGPFNSWEKHKYNTRCYRQYFRYFVQPDGVVEYCKPETLRYYEALILGAVNRKDFKNRWTYIAKIMLQSLWVTRIKRYHPLCLAPCECEEHIDCFMRQKDKGHWSEFWMERDFKPLSEEDKNLFSRFVKENVNDSFSKELMDFL